VAKCIVSILLVLAALLLPAGALGNEHGDSTNGGHTDASTKSWAHLIPEFGIVANVGMAWHFGGPGIIQAGHAMDENGFTLQGLEVSVSGSVDRYFGYDLQFDLAHLELKNAYITTLSLPINMTVKAGYMTVPFGRQNQHCLHSWNFASPSLAHTRFMGEDAFSGLGAELSFRIPLPWAMIIGAQFLDAHSRTGLRSATFARVDDTGSGRLDGMEDFVYTARMDNTFRIKDNWLLAWGLSGAWGQSPLAPDSRSDLYGTDIYLRYAPDSPGTKPLFVAFTLEYMFRRMHSADGIPMDHGGLAQVDIQVTENWAVGARGDLTMMLAGASPDPDTMPDLQWRFGTSVTFIPTHMSKLRLGYDLGRRQENDAIYHAVLLQLEVAIDTHGEHEHAH